MLKRCIIAKLLIEDGVLVKYKNFTNGRRVVGDPVSTMGILEHQILDEFFICDLGVVDVDLITRMTENIFIPVTIAGSVTTMEQIGDLFRNAGVDKIVIKDPELQRRAAMKWGAQAVAMKIDYGGDAPFFDIPDWVGEVILTSVDRDGMGEGFDLGAVRFPYKKRITLAGGCGKLSHVKDAFAAGADAVCISSMFAFSDKSPIKLRSWLNSEGVAVRMV